MNPGDVPNTMRLIMPSPPALAVQFLVNLLQAVQILPDALDLLAGPLRLFSLAEKGGEQLSPRAGLWRPSTVGKLPEEALDVLVRPTIVSIWIVRGHVEAGQAKQGPIGCRFLTERPPVGLVSTPVVAHPDHLLGPGDPAVLGRTGQRQAAAGHQQRQSQ